MGWFVSIFLLLVYIFSGEINVHNDYILIASGLFAIAGTIGWNASNIGNKTRKD